MRPERENLSRRTGDINFGGPQENCQDMLMKGSYFLILSVNINIPSMYTN